MVVKFEHDSATAFARYGLAHVQEKERSNVQKMLRKVYDADFVKFSQFDVEIAVKAAEPFYMPIYIVKYNYNYGTEQEVVSVDADGSIRLKSQEDEEEKTVEASASPKATLNQLFGTHTYALYINGATGATYTESRPYSVQKILLGTLIASALPLRTILRLLRR